jgi:hypothetical protein
MKTAGGLGVAKAVRIGEGLYVKSGSWLSTGNDIILNGNSGSIYLRPVEGSANNELINSSTETIIRNSSGNAIWTLNKSTNAVTATGQQLITNNTASTTTTSGAVQVTGGVGIQGGLNVGGTSGLNAMNCVTGSVSSSTASTNTSTGAFVVTGGLGVGGTINAGALSTTGAVTGVSGSLGSLTVSNGSGQTVLVSSVEPSSSTTTGAVRVVGGLGVGGTINAGALTTTGAITGVTGSVSSASSSAFTIPNGGLVVGNTVSAGNITTAGGVTGVVGSLGSLTVSNGSGQTVLVSSTEASTSTTTGCARFNGGIGVADRVTSTSVDSTSIFCSTLDASTSVTINGVQLSAAYANLALPVVSLSLGGSVSYSVRQAEYQRVGYHVTAYVKIEATYTQGVSNEIGFTNLTPSAVGTVEVYPAFIPFVELCELSGFSKPYFVT